MSQCEIYAVRPNGEVEHYGEAHNAFGGAMHIWLALKSKYHTGGGILEGFQVLWNSIQKMQVTDQWVLASTFDRVIVPKEQLDTFIVHLNTFVVETAWSDTLSEELQVLKKALDDDQVRGICFTQTSVSESHWFIYREGEERPYNINIDSDHWFLAPETLANLNKGEKGE